MTAINLDDPRTRFYAHTTAGGLALTAHHPDAGSQHIHVDMRDCEVAAPVYKAALQAVEEARLRHNARLDADAAAKRAALDQSGRPAWPSMRDQEG